MSASSKHWLNDLVDFLGCNGLIGFICHISLVGGIGRIGLSGIIGIISLICLNSRFGILGCINYISLVRSIGISSINGLVGQISLVSLSSQNGIIRFIGLSINFFGLNLAFSRNLAFGHNLAFGLTMAFGLIMAFGRNLSFGLIMAFGLNLAFGRNLAISHNLAFGPTMAFGLIMAFGLFSFGLSLVSLSRLIIDISLIGPRGISGLVGLIGPVLVGVANHKGFIGRISLVGQFSLVNHNGLVSLSLIGLSLAGLISNISLSGLISIISFIGGFVGFVSLGLISIGGLISNISLVGPGCFSGWLARARKKMWYSNNNDALQDCFAAAILAAAAKTHRVAIKLTSATKITNAAIWYYCAALLVFLSFVCEGELVVTCAFYHRLNSRFSLFFGDA